MEREREGERGFNNEYKLFGHSTVSIIKMSLWLKATLRQSVYNLTRDWSFAV